MPLLFTLDDLMMAFGQGSTDPMQVFVDSIVHLLSLPSPSIVEDTVCIARQCFEKNQSNIQALVSMKLISRIFSTPHLRDLSVINEKGLLRNLLTILQASVWLVPTERPPKIPSNYDNRPQSLRDLVLHDALIPMEPPLVQLNRGYHLLSWKSGSEDLLTFVTHILNASVFHPPTLDFVCSSRLPLVFQSLLTEVEDTRIVYTCISSISNKIQKWVDDGVEFELGGRRLLLKLEQEGFIDILEAKLTLHYSKDRLGHGHGPSMAILCFLGSHSNTPRFYIDPIVLWILQQRIQ
ncbi:hypothetical protein BLNAU_19040 [Blattamonas nauphoetae]|uniref:Uncharacterized protein n=1 Tax=Blattamonas nauphoetae TaxID=2049346 RepID=A0ABQ9X3X2_9EUKA|nr:hypothetical protein BLNAU_19040 [Blattamonas nauphoetae]